MKVIFYRSIALTVAFLLTGAIAKADICVGESFNVSEIVGRVVAVWRMGEQSVPRVLVELKQFRHDEWKTKLKTYTDENGRFRITNVRSGTYRLDFTPEGLAPHTVEIRLRKSRTASTKEIVVTTGTGVHFCPSAELRARTVSIDNTPNKSLDRSAGRVFRNLID